MATSSKRGEKTQAVREFQEQNPDASAPEIMAALKAQGIEVSQGLVYNVKSDSNKKKASRKRGGKSATRARSNGTLQHGEKSEAVRAALRKLGRKTPPAQIMDYVAAQGLAVSMALIAKVKSRMNSRRRKKGRPEKALAATSAAPKRTQITWDDLSAAKKLADQLGSIETLRRTVDALDTLMRKPR